MTNVEVENRSMVVRGEGCGMGVALKEWYQGVSLSLWNISES